MKQYDQKFEAHLAHVVGMARDWGFRAGEGNGGPHTHELVQAYREMREFYYGGEPPQRASDTSTDAP